MLLPQLVVDFFLLTQRKQLICYEKCSRIWLPTFNNKIAKLVWGAGDWGLDKRNEISSLKR